MRVEALSNVDRDGILDRLVSTHGSITSVAKAYVDRYGGELESTRVLLGRIRRRAVRTVVARTWQRLVWLAPDLVEEFLDERAEIEKIAADSPLARRVWLDRKAAELAAAIEAYPSG